MISAVVFDLFGTLTGFESHRDVHVVRLAEALGVPIEELRALLGSTYDERARGIYGDARQQLVALAERMGADLRPDLIDRALEVRMDGQWSLLQPRPGALEVLHALRARGLKIGVLSDCTDEIPKLWSRSPYAALVDFAIFSCDLGLRKPHPTMYETVLAGLHARAAETLYVGDGGSSELSGARAAGLRPVLLKVPGEHHFRYDEEIGWNGESIADLADVISLVDD